jgi:hypothetical protein
MSLAMLQTSTIGLVVNAVYLPPRTTTQLAAQGLRTTLEGTAKASQVSDTVMLRYYWKYYDIMKGITNISAVWSEVSK